MLRHRAHVQHGLTRVHARGSATPRRTILMLSVILTLAPGYCRAGASVDFLGAFVADAPTAFVWLALGAFAVASRQPHPEAVAPELPRALEPEPLADGTCGKWSGSM